MKTLLFSFLAVVTTAAAADNAAVSGKWQVHNSISGNESDVVCTFVQKDDSLTGSCEADKGPMAITGKVTGKKVTWSYKSEYNGTPLTVNYDGALDSATKIKGSVDVPEFSAGGDFIATQAN